LRESLDLLGATHGAFVDSVMSGGQEIPTNEDSPKDGNRNKVRRALDCAVINFLHDSMELKRQRSFDTVRGVFAEGARIYPGAEIYRLTHVQVAVLNEKCIIGAFHPQ